MNGFEFKQKDKININKKDYELDISDLGVIEGISIHFPQLIMTLSEITSKKEDLIKYKAKIQNHSYTDDEEEALKNEVQAISDDIWKKTNEYVEYAQSFILSSLGQSAYDDIFGNRGTNVEELIGLSSYIYEWVNSKRKDVQKEYILPSNREARREVEKKKRKPRTKKPIEVEKNNDSELPK